MLSSRNSQAHQVEKNHKDSRFKCFYFWHAFNYLQRQPITHIPSPSSLIPALMTTLGSKTLFTQRAVQWQPWEMNDWPGIRLDCRNMQGWLWTPNIHSHMPTCCHHEGPQPHGDEKNHWCLSSIWLFSSVMERAGAQRSDWQPVVLVLSPAAIGRATERLSSRTKPFSPSNTKHFLCSQSPFWRGIQDICYFNHNLIWIFHLSDCDKLLSPDIRLNCPSTSKQHRWGGNQAHSYLATS